LALQALAYINLAVQDAIAMDQVLVDGDALLNSVCMAEEYAHGAADFMEKAADALCKLKRTGVV
jgi:hypothetical protein